MAPLSFRWLTGGPPAPELELADNDSTFIIHATKKQSRIDDYSNLEVFV
jgi:hypothetical protein